MERLSGENRGHCLVNGEVKSDFREATKPRNEDEGERGLLGQQARWAERSQKTVGGQEEFQSFDFTKTNQ